MGVAEFISHLYSELRGGGRTWQHEPGGLWESGFEMMPHKDGMPQVPKGGCDWLV